MLANSVNEIFQFGIYFSMINFAMGIAGGAGYVFVERESWAVKTFCTGFLAAWILAPVVSYTMLRPLGLDLI